MSSSPRTRPTPGTVVTVSAVLLLIALAAAAVALGFDPLGGAQGFVTGLYPPVAVTEQGARIRDLYTIVFLVAAAIFLLVEGLIIWSVIRYRRKPGDDTLPAQTHGNNLAELVWTIVPSLIVVGLFVVSWQTLNAVDTAAADPETRIRAVAGQFQWQFDYLSDDGQTVLYTQSQAAGEGGGMAVPAGRTVQLTLTSQDVIHAFYVPQFLFKRDVVPGRVNQFDFKVNASDAGQTFRGQCAELCGTGHRIMLFEVHALSPADFDAWLDAKIAEANPTPPPPPSGEAGVTLEVSALNVAFEQASLTAPAGAPFQIVFDNQDSGVPHNVAIHKDLPTGEEVFKGEIFSGPDKRTYDVAPLEAGAYAFVCTVHPTMTGTLTVE
ncbi:MAG: cytochrome c oxidase subunit II [Candidatus Limnocylindrales bacterium]|nr:cytochrome c oxidase subunit II [Candidatus Limnocylindrales bacterium]